MFTQKKSMQALKAYQKFHIHPHKNLENSKVEFHYSFDHEVFFKEIIDFSSENYVTKQKINDKNTQILLQHLSIALGISYYKLFPVEDIVLENFWIDDDQQEFRKKFYNKWLGEFRYVNKLNPNALKTITSKWEELPQINIAPLRESNHLVPFWWWKDSFVTAEKLIREEKEITPFCFGKEYLIHSLWTQSLWKEKLLIKRTLDLEKLWEMGQRWYYNGHVPITGIISMVTIIICYLYGFDHVHFSNEKSANFGNTERKWVTINHQRSKSEEFEENFRKYIEKYISTSIVYKSKLRDLFEIKIAQQFSKYKKHLTQFSSCNKNFAISKEAEKKRCNDCPKCFFVYLIMRPFLLLEDVVHIWWKDLYENYDNLYEFQELRGVRWIKPLECVWTEEECKVATWLFIQRNPKYTSSITEYFKENILPQKTNSERETLWVSLLWE